jgi:hypothetical protein
MTQSPSKSDVLADFDILTLAMDDLIANCLMGVHSAN